MWEFTPWEFGAWAFGANTKVPGAFTPLEYLGTGLNNGQPNGTCYKGFDQMSYVALNPANAPLANLSFVMGTSSTLFNGALLSLNSSQSEGFFLEAIQGVLGKISDAENDVARVPNTFAKWDEQTNPVSRVSYLDTTRADNRSPTCNTSLWSTPD